ncbi:MAG: hypothetical protein JWN15_1777 [Firmicutes bacterium]|nr:hypothetical protein [Bacillota bacterium]
MTAHSVYHGGEESQPWGDKMHEEETGNLPAFLGEGRRMLAEAPQEYGRELSAVEYWWLGVALAAVTLAELGEKPYAARRVEQLVDRLGYRGVKDDWLQRFIDELAGLDAEGLVWPLYQRSPEGPMAATGAAVYPEFGAQDGYFLALAHIGVALAVHREEQAVVADLAGTVGEIVASGVTPAHERLIVAALKPLEGADDQA